MEAPGNKTQRVRKETTVFFRGLGCTGVQRSNDVQTITKYMSNIPQGKFPQDLLFLSQIWKSGIADVGSAMCLLITVDNISCVPTAVYTHCFSFFNKILIFLKSPFSSL